MSQVLNFALENHMIYFDAYQQHICETNMLEPEISRYPVNIADAGPNRALHWHAKVTCMGIAGQTPAAGWRMKDRVK